LSSRRKGLAPRSANHAAEAVMLASLLLAQGEKRRRLALPAPAAVQRWGDFDE